MFHAHVFLAGAYLSLVSASIYPTQPVQATVWSADQPMLVSWIEDWKYPELSKMGLVDISLWRDTDTYLVPLASGVDPTAKTRQLTVPGSVLREGSIYTLQFSTSQPEEMVIYSADFAIIPANTTTGLSAGAGTGTGSGGVMLATQGGTGTGTNTGTGFQTAFAATGSSSWTTTTGLPTGQPTTSSSGVPQSSGGTTPSNGVPGRVANAGRRGMDVEKLKFQFVFVIWPMLMGISMAL